MFAPILPSPTIPSCIDRSLPEPSVSCLNCASFWTGQAHGRLITEVIFILTGKIELPAARPCGLATIAQCRDLSMMLRTISRSHAVQRNRAFDQAHVDSLRSRRKSGSRFTTMRRVSCLCESIIHRSELLERSQQPVIAAQNKRTVSNSAVNFDAIALNRPYIQY
jgi:hypothetical protein